MPDIAARVTNVEPLHAKQVPINTVVVSESSNINADKKLSVKDYIVDMVDAVNSSAVMKDRPDGINDALKDNAKRASPYKQLTMDDHADGLHEEVEASKQ